MGKHIRRTVTITITETWTLVWLPDDDPLPDPPTIGQAPTKEEPPDEAQQITLTPGEPPPSPPPPTVTVEPQLGDTANHSTSRRRAKHTCPHRTGKR